MKEIKPGEAIKAFFAAAVAILTIIFANETSQSVTKSIDICLSSVIPSMFSFMVISSYILSSGLYRIILKPVLFIIRMIIKADDRTLSVFLLSLFGGYPVGLKLLSEITSYNKNYHAISEKTASFCYCVSPSFALIMLGEGVFSSLDAGLIIYISNIFACIICAAVMSRLYDLKTKEASPLPCGSGGLVEAIISSARSLLTVCSVIIVFNIVITCLRCVIAQFGDNDLTFLYGVLEITNLTGLKQVSVSMIPFVSAVSSFGGICVLFQCSAIVNKKFSLKGFLLMRLPCSLLSALISYILLAFWDISIETSVNSGRYIYSFSANKAVVVLLAIMCIIIFRKNEKILKKV